jgi:hypothetical protein
MSRDSPIPYLASIYLPPIQVRHPSFVRAREIETDRPGRVSRGFAAKRLWIGEAKAAEHPSCIISEGTTLAILCNCFRQQQTMHILILVLLAALAAFVIYNIVKRQSLAGQPRPVVQTGKDFAFLSNGKLFTRKAGAIQELESTYINETIKRREQARDRHSWKQGTSFEVSANRGARDFDQGDAPIQATSALYLPDGSLLYILRDEAIGGLFKRSAASGNEERLVLKQGLVAADLALSPDAQTLALSSEQSGGVAQIALVKIDGGGYRTVTGGDTVDSAPAWIPQAPQQLLFQSSGLARDKEGYVLARGPASILKLDMEAGKVTPVLEDSGFDFLRPRVSNDGALLFIRRPYEGSGYGASSALLDTLLFPFRLLRALFHYLNFFSLMYSRKPLTSAGGPQQSADLKSIYVQGRRLDAERNLRSAGAVQGVPSLVPASWQLIRRDQNGGEAVLATNVLSYDLASDGSIVYTNGQGVFALQAHGNAALLLEGQLVTEVVAGN